ncbi:Hydroxyethylthiazole kinase [Epithele typhae]|uniref:Hydroxyethylthiazole kinase n=1 Tax=Epithele typhae TaxID=378194 RepID=UPI002007DC01|nr:Hydroxyethylthiazole kinase [Epithele typhae]KAH9942289.1 Hydroxyethylthiazole kinase [Epithele typhae]
MSEDKPVLDYSVYLVTGRELLPTGKTYLESLEESLIGGVTLVQVREKQVDTGEFIRIAQATKEVCRRHQVPVLINDRIDVALAIGADGVHIGQSDMPVSIARKLLPPNAIIGMTCNTSEHVQQAIKDGVDYIGLGPVWPTTTKKDAQGAVGVRGIGAMLEILETVPEGRGIRAVSIGGIKSTNALHCLHGSVSPSGRILDGLAVVSDIVASNDPRAAANRIASVVQAFKTNPITTFSYAPSAYQPASIKHAVGELLSVVRQHSPLIHQITNNVVTTQSANATIALGASPIMATAPEEMADLSAAAGALLVNFGTIQNLDGMLSAGRNYNLRRKPVVFDPVGVGATAFRKSSAAALLDAWQATVIKGNAGELAALANWAEVEAKGVDSVGKGFADPAGFVRHLAKKQRAIAVLTGKDDYISDGDRVVRLSNGHPLLGEITGSGCMVGTAVATFCAAASIAAMNSRAPDAPEDAQIARGDMFTAAVGGVLAITIASELAAAKSDIVRGSGTFLPALIDELGALTPEKIVIHAKVEVM